MLARAVSTLHHTVDVLRLRELLNSRVDLSLVHPPTADECDILSTAFGLDPSHYKEYLPNFMAKYPQHFLQWLGDVLFYDRLNIDLFFDGCGLGFAFSLYTFLNKAYPPENRTHPGACHSLDKIDEIYLFKSHILDYLCKKGTTEGRNIIVKIAQEFPTEDFEHWLNVADSYIRNGLSNRALVAISDLRAIADGGKGSGRVLVSNSEELLRLVKRLLDEFGTAIHKGHRAVRMLWNEVPATLVKETKVEKSKSFTFPKKESYLSDVVAMYLEGRLEGCLVNREVLVSPAYSAKSTVRSGYADIKIEIPQENGNTCVVFVEVKCSFNKELPTALNNQLYRKYVLSVGNSAGLLLCGCYRAKDWTNADCRARRNAKLGYDTVTAATAEMEQQFITMGTPSNIDYLAIDCSLH